MDDLSHGMRDKTHPPRAWAQTELARLAARRYGVVAIWHLLDLGFVREGVRRMVQAGRLHPLYRGVYAVGHRSLSPRGRLLAAVYACGRDAVASHHAAGWLWNVRRARGSKHHVTVAARGRKGPRGIALHCVRRLHPEDVTVIDGIPVTSLARTLVDLGALLPLKQLRRAFEEADRLGLLDAAAVQRACDRGKGRKGVANARRALELYEPDPPKTRSDLEKDFFDWCDANGIPRPSANLWVAGQEVDMAWLDELGRPIAVVELDSREYHSTLEAFERDRERSAALEAARIPHIRVTSRRMRRDSERLRSQVLSLLAVRPFAPQKDEGPA